VSAAEDLPLSEPIQTGLGLVVEVRRQRGVSVHLGEAPRAGGDEPFELRGEGLEELTLPSGVEHGHGLVVVVVPHHRVAAQGVLEVAGLHLHRHPEIAPGSILVEDLLAHVGQGQGQPAVVEAVEG